MLHTVSWSLTVFHMHNISRIINMLIPILDKNMHGYLSTDITCSKKRTAFLIKAKLKENCELHGTDNVQGQIAIHIFAPNRGYYNFSSTTTFHSLTKQTSNGPPLNLSNQSLQNKTNCFFVLEKFLAMS